MKKKMSSQECKKRIRRFLLGFDFVSGSEEEDRGPAERGEGSCGRSVVSEFCVRGSNMN